MCVISAISIMLIGKILEKFTNYNLYYDNFFQIFFSYPQIPVLLFGIYYELRNKN